MHLYMYAYVFMHKKLTHKVKEQSKEIKVCVGDIEDET